MDTLTADQVHQKLLSDNDTVVINTLGKDSFLAKHIPGSINIPAGEVEDRAKQVIPDTDQEIIVYCASPDCPASPQAAETLKEMGYSNVYDFEDGIAGWLDANYALSREEDSKSITA